MLHIILLILKIAGLIILSLLILILCLLFIIIFASFRYTIDADINNSIKSLNVRIRFSWLMHLISGRVEWKQGDLSWHLRGAWKSCHNENNNNDEDRGHVSEKSDPEQFSSDNSCTCKTEKKNDPQSSEQFEKAETVHSIKHEKRKNSFFRKCESIYARIKYTFKHFCDKIQAMKDKKEKVISFLDNELHKRAFVRLFSETKKLLKRLYPDTGNGNITFGFEDPSHTGYTLAGLSLIYPATEGNINLYPDFDRKILKGNIHISGRIRIFYALIFVLSVISDKNVRKTYRNFRKIKW